MNSDPYPCTCPLVQPWEVFKFLRTLNQRKAGIRADLPPRIIREFAYEFAKPLTNILKSSFQFSEFPRQWKYAEVVPIPKCQPATLQNLRPIALTSYLAKIAESFIVKWLLQDISNQIDPDQYGNRQGLSTNHYLISLIHQVLENAENPKSLSTIVITDYSKAFDRIDHNILARKLISLNVRPSLIHLILSFLENRRQCVKYLGTTSDCMSIHTGVPQGTKLGPILFLIMSNDACVDSEIPYYKYVDDLTLVESLKHTHLSHMQCEINKLCKWSEQNNMLLNPVKCSVMFVSFMKEPPPQFPLTIGNDILKVVSQAKILGLLLQNNLKWDAHILDLEKRCNRKLYMLRSLKKFNLPIRDLITVYCGYIRPVLEYGVPVFGGSLTQDQIYKLEQIQKRACRIMLGSVYETYDSALNMCNLQSLEHRRKKLCLDFAHSVEKNVFTRHWLKTKKENPYNLRKGMKYEQFKCKTKRFKSSSLPYLVTLLNSE